MRALGVMVIILDFLLLVLGVILGGVASVGVGMARAPGPLGAPAGPMSAWETYLIVGQCVGVAMLAVAPSAFMLWLGKDRTALTLAVIPVLIAMTALWLVRKVF